MRFLAVAIISLCTFQVQCAEIHVNNKTGSDRNDGLKPTSAVASFAQAMIIARPGDILNIANTGNIYYESLFLRGELGKDGRSFVVEGNGATISGLADLDMSKFSVMGTGYFLNIGKRNSNVKPKLFIDGKVLPEAVRAETTKPGEFCWTGDGFFFIPAVNRKIADYKFQGSLRDSGVVFIGARNVLVRNVISEHNSNDGFNLHGSCFGITAENITGRFNGDDGFSAHEDVEAEVRNGRFYGNSYGIEDVNASLTSYRNVVVENNLVGVHFSGGIRRLIGCRIENNGIQVVVDPGASAAYLGADKEPAIFNGSCFIKNTVIKGDEIGLRVGAKSAVTLINSEIKSAKIAIDLLPGAELFAIADVIQGAVAIQMNQAKVFGDKNLFFPDKFKINGADTDFVGFKKATSSNALSLCEIPKYQDCKLQQQPFMDKSPRIMLGPGL